MSPGLPIKTTWNRITQESRDTTQKEAATAPKVAGEVDETAAKLHCVAQVQPDTLHETEPWLKQAASLGSLWCPYGVLWFLHVPHWSFPLRTSVLQGGALWSLLTDMQNQAMPYHCSIYSTVHSLYVTVQYIGIYWLCAHIMHTCAGSYKHSWILVCMHTCTRRYMYIYIYIRFFLSYNFHTNESCPWYLYSNPVELSSRYFCFRGRLPLGFLVAAPLGSVGWGFLHTTRVPSF